MFGYHVESVQEIRERCGSLTTGNTFGGGSGALVGISPGSGKFVVGKGLASPLGDGGDYRPKEREGGGRARAGSVKKERGARK